MLASVGLALLLAGGGTISWSEVRSDIEETICVLVHELPDGSTAHAFVTGGRRECADQETKGPVSRAVDAALDDARILLSATGAGHVGFVFDPGRSLDENNRAMRGAYLATDRFLQPILRRLPGALVGQGLTCPDCPAAVAPESHQTTWERFVPYLTAYVWPDPVTTPTDAAGKPTGKPQYAFHICAGLNGIAEIEEADPRLVHAGFVVAMATEELRQIALAQFRGLLARTEFVELADDESRTEYLRRHLGPRLAGDERLAPSVCGTVERYRQDLGLIVTGCPAAAE